MFIKMILNRIFIKKGKKKGKKIGESINGKKAF